MDTSTAGRASTSTPLGFSFAGASAHIFLSAPTTASPSCRWMQVQNSCRKCPVCKAGVETDKVLSSGFACPCPCWLLLGWEIVTVSLCSCTGHPNLWTWVRADRSPQEHCAIGRRGHDSEAPCWTAAASSAGACSHSSPQGQRRHWGSLPGI